jgi:methionine-rich copper-binding protein CopC
MTRGFLRHLCAVVAVALAMTIATATSASAHTKLISSTPMAGQHLKKSPARVSATFDQVLLPTGDAMVVTDAQHHFVSVGTAQLEGATISVAVKPDLPDGVYQAAYRVISADGHPVESAFTFIVGSASTASAAPTLQPAGAAAAADQPALVKFFVPGLVACFVLFVASGAIRRHRSRRDSTDDEVPPGS